VEPRRAPIPARLPHTFRGKSRSALWQGLSWPLRMILSLIFEFSGPRTLIEATLAHELGNSPCQN
jgi:hypothetical protein